MIKTVPPQELLNFGDWAVYEMKPADSELESTLTLDKVIIDSKNGNIGSFFLSQLTALSNHVTKCFPDGFEANETSSLVQTLATLIDDIPSSESELTCCKLQLASLNALLQSDNIDCKSKQEALNAIGKYLSHANDITPDFMPYLIYLNFAKAKRQDLVAHAQNSLLKEAQKVFIQRYPEDQHAQHLDRAAIALGACLIVNSEQEQAQDVLTDVLLECFRPILFSVMSSGAIILKISESLAEQLKTEIQTDLTASPEQASATSISQTTTALLNTLCDQHDFDLNKTTARSQAESDTSFTSSVELVKLPEVNETDLQQPQTLYQLISFLHRAIAFRACCFNILTPCFISKQDTDGQIHTSFDDLCLFQSSSTPNIQTDTVLSLEHSPKTLPSSLIQANLAHQLLYHRQLITSATITKLVSYLKEVEKLDESLDGIVKAGIKCMCCSRFKETVQQPNAPLLTLDDSFKVMASKIIAAESKQWVQELSCIKNESKSQCVQTLIAHLSKLPEEIIDDTGSSQTCCTAYQEKVKELELTSIDVLQIITQQTASIDPKVAHWIKNSFFQALESDLKNATNNDEYLATLESVKKPGIYIDMNEAARFLDVCINTLPKFINQFSASDLERLTNIFFGTACIKEELTQIMVTGACTLIANRKSLDELQAVISKLELLIQKSPHHMKQQIEEAYTAQLVQVEDSDYEQLDIQTFNSLVSQTGVKQLCAKTIELGKSGLCMKLYHTLSETINKSQLRDLINLSVGHHQYRCFKALFQLAVKDEVHNHDQIRKLISLIIDSCDEPAEYLTIVSSSPKFSDACDNKQQVSPLLYAVNQNKLEAIRWFISKRPHMLYHTDADFKTSFHIACVANKHEVLQILIQHEYQDEDEASLIVNQVDNSSRSALLLACQHQSIKCIRALLDYQETDAYACCGLNGKNALHYAMETENTEVTSLLLDKHPNLIYQQSHDGLTPVGAAIDRKKHQLATTCISQCTNFNFAQPVYNDLPFIAMVCLGESDSDYDADVVNKAINHADLNAQYGEQQQTIMHLATASGVYFSELLAIATVEQLKVRDANGTSLVHVAATQGSISRFNALKKKKLNPQTLDLNGNNAILYAVRAGQANFVLRIAQTVHLQTTKQTAASLLTAAIENDRGEVLEKLTGNWCYGAIFTPLLSDPGINVLMTAVQHNAIHVIKALPADIIKNSFIISDDEFDPMMLAAKLDHADAARAIIEKLRLTTISAGALNNTSQGKLAIHIAIEHRSLNYLEFCIDQNIQLRNTFLDSTSKFYSYTPLMYAAYLDKPEAVEILIQDQTHCHLTANGLNAAHIATQNNSLKTIGLFGKNMINSRVDRGGSEYYSFTCLHIAVKNNNPIMVRELIHHGASTQIEAYSHGDLSFTPLVVGILGSCHEAVSELLNNGDQLSHMIKSTAETNNKDAYAFKLINEAYHDFNKSHIRYTLWSKFKEFNPR